MLNSSINGNMSALLSLPVRISISFIMFCFILTTIFGNTLVVVSVIRFSHLRKQMCFRFLCSLAISDICVALLVMQISALDFVLHYWPFNWFTCYLWMSCDVMCCTASILHLCVVAIDRYIAIAHGIYYEQLMTESRVLAAIITVWLLSCLISFVPIFADWFAPANYLVSSDSCDLEVNQIYALVSSMTSFYIPCLAIFCIYIQIYRIAQFQARKMRLEHTTRADSRKTRNDRKAIRTLGLIVGLFSLCWFPFFIMYLVRAFCTSCQLSKEWVFFITWIGYVNSSLNPILYCFIQKEFRNSFIRLICSVLPCVCSRLHLDKLSSFSKDKHQNSVVSVDDAVSKFVNSNTTRSQSHNSSKFD